MTYQINHGFKYNILIHRHIWASGYPGKGKLRSSIIFYAKSLSKKFYNLNFYETLVCVYESFREVRDMFDYLKFYDLRLNEYLTLLVPTLKRRLRDRKDELQKKKNPLTLEQATYYFSPTYLEFFKKGYFMDWDSYPVCY